MTFSKYWIDNHFLNIADGCKVRIVGVDEQADCLYKDLPKTFVCDYLSIDSVLYGDIYNMTLYTSVNNQIKKLKKSSG